MYHRGIMEKFEWDGMMQCCGGDYNQLAFCDVTKFVYLDQAGNAHPINDSNVCDKIFGDIVQKFWGYGSVLDVYNIYQDCYQQKQVVFGSRNMRRHKEKIRQSLLTEPELHILAQKSVNTIQNVYSTDNQGGFPCFASSAAQTWLNTPDVRKALHIPDYVQSWTDCNDQINNDYIQQYNDTGGVFDDIINSGRKCQAPHTYLAHDSLDPMRLLVYNGDVTTFYKIIKHILSRWIWCAIS